MPTKTEFKFNCPTCGQHILAAVEWIGRRINCPSCETPITVAAPPKEAKKPAPVMVPGQVTTPDSASRTNRVELPARGTKAVAMPTQASPATVTVLPTTGGSENKAKSPSVVPVESPQLRIAALTPAIKLEMVRAVRGRIADESAWLPGVVNGRKAYAAKASSGDAVLVDVASPEAARFSLIGAFLLEFRLRQVVRTAAGRTKFLDQEIPDAVHEVMTEDLSDEEREHTEGATAEQNLARITHAQCLAALEVLEEQYSQRMNQARAEKAARRIGNFRLPDLIKKLEKKARIAPEDVATAFYHELMEVRRRLDRLESRMLHEK